MAGGAPDSMRPAGAGAGLCEAGRPGRREGQLTGRELDLVADLAGVGGVSHRQLADRRPGPPPARSPMAGGEGPGGRIPRRARWSRRGAPRRWWAGGTPTGPGLPCCCTAITTWSRLMSASGAGPPFEVRRKGGRLYGRGVSDDKGFVVAQLQAVRRLAAANRGRPPVNLRCLYEGEEEVGSPSLGNLLGAYGPALAADAAIVFDTEGAVHDRVSITVSCRGGVTVDIAVAGPARDLHAGRFGGAVGSRRRP